ncbi:hypothetical protein SY85_14400 [Flavisolibacter tropicus]|uniref:Uncharacterized protein n=1 Tax=Flavisolibacter tropicus TaxID=1492898 RepID=A0A172TX26_9BACT|nr:hypothetical protein SY85_14400 [Flavisolibacter tropicus]
MLPLVANPECSKDQAQHAPAPKGERQRCWEPQRHGEQGETQRMCGPQITQINAEEGSHRAKEERREY